MLPSNVDPRRPDKVHRYKPPLASANGPGEDLTPDYMNILGQRATTANAPSETSDPKNVVIEGVVNSSAPASVAVDAANLQHQQQIGNGEETIVVHSLATVAEESSNSNVGATTTTNVIPTSPQYGVAIIPNTTVTAPVGVNNNSTSALDIIPPETVTLSNDTGTADAVIKQTAEDGKDIHSTPSRNDRFKVVKIASLEPFKRGRWKCMDYVDEAPPALNNQQQQQQNKINQSATNIPVGATTGVYLQTQSLPQQQIQQMLMQSGYSNGTQFFQNVPAQMMPQAQYFYQPTGTNLQTQTLPQQLVNTSGVPTSMPAQFINTNQPYFTTGVVQNSGGYPMTANYQNVQYVPANLIQNQNSAFVPTSQTVQLPSNFQQSQTYAGQPNISQPMVNGHAYPPQQNEHQQQQQQQAPTSLPSQTAKSVILNSTTPQQQQQQQQQPQQQPVVSQTQLTQPTMQNQMHMVQSNTTQSQSVPVIQNQQQYQQQANFQQQQQPPHQQVQTNQVQSSGNNTVPQQIQQQQQPQQQQTLLVNSNSAGPQIVSAVQSQTFDQNQQASNVYTNPQFDTAASSLTTLDNPETSGSTDTVISENAAAASAVTSQTVTAADATPSGDTNPEDPSKTNPVVNAIDNKIEQAMDLVKSHLMYTVREEVEVLKEKIAELMERIQQLETENNFLRSLLPKNQTIGGGGGGVAQPPPPTNTAATLPVVTATVSATPLPVIINNGPPLMQQQQQPQSVVAQQVVTNVPQQGTTSNSNNVASNAVISNETVIGNQLPPHQHQQQQQQQQ